MDCQRCAVESANGSLFCSECGTPLRSRCPQCGADNLPRAKFCGACGTPLRGLQPDQPAMLSQPGVSSIPAPLTETMRASRPLLVGERKLVTVLFADLQGVMEQMAERDPEEVRQLLDPVLQRLIEAVHPYEGTVNQVLGDGIMALFGAPIAHEDHALRACYAALAMQEAMQQYNRQQRQTHGFDVRIRVGLNSGEVVVRTIGSDLHMDYSAVGQATHLAARMEQLAIPGSIRLTAATLRLVEGYVQVNDLGRLAVKGLMEPVPVYELVGIGPLRGRFQAAAARGLTRFVGRQTELRFLQQAFRHVEAGHGQVVAVSGEAGVGKSRLLHEGMQLYATGRWLVLESAGVSYGKTTAYAPVVDWLKRYCHVVEGDTPQAITAKVSEQILALDRTLAEAIPAVLSLLDALPPQSDFWTLDALQRRRLTRDALIRLWRQEGQRQPVLLVCEDLHWIDTETQGLLDILVTHLPSACILLLVTHRPEYRPTWGDQVYFTPIQLQPLSPVRAEEFLQALLGDDGRGSQASSLAALRQLLIARTEGNPFFLEESVRTLVETNVLIGAPGDYRLARELPAVSVPNTVQAVIAARIDRLPPQDKHLLQTAAVIGTKLPLSLLRALLDLPEGQLRRGLAHLQAAEFLDVADTAPELVYTFKHALTHDVAYGSLLQERRRAIHARIVETIERLYAERLGDWLEWLAHHALRGELWGKAIAYLRQVGSKMAARSAHREAVTWLEEALEALQHQPDDLERRALAIDVRFDLRHALYPLGEYDRILQLLGEAERLAESLADARRLGWVSAYLTSSFLQRQDYDRALASGQRALTLAAERDDLGLQVMAHFFLGQVYYHRGEYRQSADVLGQNIDVLRGPLLYERFDLPYLPAVQSSAWLVRALAELGRFDEGARVGEEALHAAETSDPFSLVHMHYSLGFLHLRRGDLSQASAVLEPGLALAERLQLSTWFPVMTAALGYAQARAGRLCLAIPLLEAVIQRLASQRTIFFHPVTLAWLSEAWLLVGRLDEAMTLVHQALELSRERQEQGNQAWSLRLLGAITAAHDTGEGTKVMAAYRQALILAENLGIRPLAAHCHHGLGVIYAQLGQRQTATHELTTALALYQAMQMTSWEPTVEERLREVKGH